MGMYNKMEYKYGYVYNIIFYFLSSYLTVQLLGPCCETVSGNCFFYTRHH